MATYSEKDLASIKEKQILFKDKSGMYRALAKGGLRASYLLAILAVVYNALTAYYGNEFLTGSITFSITFLLGIAITLIWTAFARKWHKKVVICEAYIAKHEYDFNINAPHKN